MFIRELMIGLEPTTYALPTETYAFYSFFKFLYLAIYTEIQEFYAVSFYKVHHITKLLCTSCDT